MIHHRDSLLLHLCALGLRLNGQKRVLTPAQHFFGSLSGLNLDAGPSGPCSGREYSVVHDPLQARSAHVSGPVSQTPRPHDGSFPGSSLGAAPYETIPLVDEVPGYSSLLAVLSPTKSVRRLFPCPLMWQDPSFLLSGVRMGVICCGAKSRGNGVRPVE